MKEKLFKLCKKKVKKKVIIKREKIKMLKIMKMIKNLQRMEKMKKMVVKMERRKKNIREEDKAVVRIVI